MQEIMRADRLNAAACEHTRSRIGYASLSRQRGDARFVEFAQPPAAAEIGAIDAEKRPV
jgi:hypothetical protein